MATTDKQEVRSGRERVSERLKGRYPDREFNDDEALFGQISDDYDDYDKRLGEYRDREQSLVDLFNADPRSAHFVSNWSRGADPVVELVRQFGDEFRAALDDPKRQEELAAAHKEFLERVSKEKELEQTYERNFEESVQTRDQFQSENGLTDDEVDEVVDLLERVYQDALMGKFTRESMEMALKAINHDVDVTEANQEGEVRGKNAKIEERLRKKNKGDGTATLDGKNGGGGRPAPTPSLGALDNFGENNQSIWERGGEKRKKSVL